MENNIEIEVILEDCVVEFLKKGDMDLRFCNCKACTQTLAKSEDIYRFYQPGATYEKVPHKHNVYKIIPSDYWIRNHSLKKTD